MGSNAGSKSVMIEVKVNQRAFSILDANPRTVSSGVVPDVSTITEETLLATSTIAHKKSIGSVVDRYGSERQASRFKGMKLKVSLPHLSITT